MLINACDILPAPLPLVDAAGNSLTGTLPSSISNLTLLEGLLLSHNRWSLLCVCTGRAVLSQVVHI